MVASVKHLAAYGQPEGGRDYNTTDMSEQRLRNLYLPPFKAAVDAGADTAMCSFNAINGVPGCANPETETQILKQEWGFDGFIESDYTAVAELRACPPKTPDTGPCGHGVAADGPSAGALALNAGTDMEMVSTNIRDYGAQLLATGQDLDRAGERRGAPDPAGQVPRRPLRAPVRRRHQGRVRAAASGRRRGGPRATRPAPWCCSRTTAPTLPLDPAKKTAVIGPLAEDQHDMLGPWWGQGQDADAVTLYDGHQGPEPGRDVRPGVPGGERRAAGGHEQRRLRLDDGFRRRGRHRQGGRPGRAGARREPRR